MTTKTSQFQVCDLQQWRGRYSRVPGDTSVFHLKYYNGRRRPAIYWETDEGRATCYALECEAVNELADAVERAKQELGGSGGGSFAINEFGQVIVPSSSGNNMRLYAGEFLGSLVFDNPFDPDSPIDLSDTSGLVPGDPWKLPYVGMPFQLSWKKEIYVKNLTEEGTESIYSQRNDSDLATEIFNLRRSGCRFIVNPSGVAITKRQSGDGNWYPHFVGEIDLHKWFEKEEV